MCLPAAVLKSDLSCHYVGLPEMGELSPVCMFGYVFFFFRANADSVRVCVFLYWCQNALNLKFRGKSCGEASQAK